MCVLWQLGHWEGMRPYDLEWGHLMGSRRAENVESLSHSKLPLVEAGYPLHLRRLAFSSSKIVVTLLGEVAFQVDASCPQDPLQSLLVVTRSIIRETSTKSDTGGHSTLLIFTLHYSFECTNLTYHTTKYLKVRFTLCSIEPNNMAFPLRVIIKYLWMNAFW